VSDRGRYRWASLVIDSDLPLPELTRVSGRRRADILVRRALPRPRPGSRATRHTWRLPDGTPWASVMTGDGEHVLRFRRFAEFIVGDEGRSICWRAPLATRPETVRHLLLDQVLPAVAFEHSLIGLHASAVVINGQGVAFAGPSSRGKSSLAASFALDGYPILTDDSLMLDWQRRVPRAVPSYPSLRLWKDAAARFLGASRGLVPVAQYTSKLRVGTHDPAIGFRVRPVRVRRIYLIEPRRGAVRIAGLSSRQAYIELLKVSFRLDPLDRAASRREVVALAAVAQHVPVARLRVPSGLQSFGDVHRAILADLDLASTRTTSGVG
jgi:hypothetical protein